MRPTSYFNPFTFAGFGLVLALTAGAVAWFNVPPFWTTVFLGLGVGSLLAWPLVWRAGLTKEPAADAPVSRDNAAVRLNAAASVFDRLQAVSDGALRAAAARMAEATRAIAALVTEDESRLAKVWDFVDYALPKAEGIVPAYLDLTRGPKLSQKQTETLDGVRDTLLHLPGLFEGYVQALRDDDIERLVAQTTQLKAIALSAPQKVA